MRGRELKHSGKVSPAEKMESRSEERRVGKEGRSLHCRKLNTESPLMRGRELKPKSRFDEVNEAKSPLMRGRELKLFGVCWV